MTTQSWKVDFDGPAREIIAETDPLSGRTSIRVDGRMAARPLGPEDQERAFSVGSVTYVIRRNGEELDLDIAPPELQAAPAPRPAAQTGVVAAAAKATPKKKPPVPVFRIIGGILLTIVIGAVVRYGFRAFTYLSVPWKTYTHSDHSFRVDFAGVPARESYTVPSAYGALPALQLKSQHGDHYYIVELIQLPPEVALQAFREDYKITNDLLASMVSSGGWKLIKKEWSTRGLNFIAQVPQSEDWPVAGSINGIMGVDGRVYIAYAFVPRGESLSFDVGEFLRSFHVAN